jgi:hypothetical protein
MGKALPQRGNLMSISTQGSDAEKAMPPRAHRNKNYVKCDEMAKKRDELVTGAVFRVEKAGRRQSGDDCSHGGTKAGWKSSAG